jgi:excisionase family DNA binding protein
LNNSLNPQVITSKSFFGVSDIAERWGVHQNFVYNLIKGGELPCLKIGNAGTKRPVIRIPLEALEAWEAKNLKATIK